MGSPDIVITTKNGVDSYRELVQRILVFSYNDTGVRINLRIRMLFGGIHSENSSHVFVSFSIVYVEFIYFFNRMFLYIVLKSILFCHS